jgi:hypothetical protein
VKNLVARPYIPSRGADKTNREHQWRHAEMGSQQPNWLARTLLIHREILFIIRKIDE